MERSNIIKITVFAVILFLAASAVYAVPVAPMQLYGAAMVNGREVPVGSVVTARIGGENRGSITLTTEGVYGILDSQYYQLYVAGTSEDIKKDIEFFVKLPGIQEITTNQTFMFQASDVFELNLFFEGAEVADPVQPLGSSGGSSGSGGGGGGGGGAAGPSTPTYSQYFDVVKADTQILILLKNSNISIVRLQLILNTELSGVSFKFQSVDSPSIDELDDVYQYIEITVPKISDENVDTAILRFKVANEWFEKNHYDPDKVALWRYHDGQWQKLETVFEGSDAETHQYRAATPGFSYFAIKSEKVQAQIVKQDDIVPAESNPEIKESAENVEAGGSESPITGMTVGSGITKTPVGIAVIAVVALAVVVLVIFIYRKQKGRGGI